MSFPGGRSRGGENRFYNPPPMRKQQQQQRTYNQRREQRSVTVKKADHNECAAASPPPPAVTNKYDNKSKFFDSTNLDRFLEYTTPVVPAQHLPKTSIRGWRGGECGLESPPYFVLEDLWESFDERSVYGAGVPLLLNGSESVIQYYGPSLSGIQLYIDPSSTFGQRRPAEESDADSSQETSSDGSNSVQGAWNNEERLCRLTRRNIHSEGSSSDESDTCNPPGQLIFEYLEHEQPRSRKPLADKISVLASHFPALRTYRSCDLSPSSWISVAWYPIYRIPTGPTLQNLDACFLTYHSLSTLSPGTGMDGLPIQSFSGRECHGADGNLQLPLRNFGLAYYKFEASFWDPDERHECQKANSLFKAADNWLRLLQVNQPDFRFFISHNTYLR